MAYDTRSKTKSNEEANTSVKGKASTSPVSETSSLRRSTRLKDLNSSPTSLKQANSSSLPSAKTTNSSTPPSTRSANSGASKSAPLEQKSTQPPSRKQKSEKEEMPNPLRRSKRLKDGAFVTSDRDETLASQLTNKKKEKSVVELTHETKQGNVTREHDGAARFRRSFTDARSYKAMFLKKLSNMNMEGCPEECNLREKLSQKAQPCREHNVCGADKCSGTVQEVLKDNYTEKAGDRGLVGESLVCSKLVCEPSLNDCQVDLLCLENGIDGQLKDPNCSESPSDDATAKVTTTDGHLSESVKELSECNEEMKASLSSQKYDCPQQCGDDLEVSPGAISEEKGGVGAQRQEVDWNVEKALSTLDMRSSTSGEQLVISTHDHEGCQNSTSAERKRKAVEIDAGISNRTVNEDTCNMIAGPTPSPDENKMLHSVETHETSLKRQRVDNVSTEQETCFCDTKVDQEPLDPAKTKVLDLGLAPGTFPGFDRNRLDDVNKLREYWHKNQNVIVIDDPDRIIKVVAFIVSLQSDVGRPFLIISTSATLFAWEREFFHLDPSMLVVRYNGNKEVCNSIRSQVLDMEGGCKMFKVLLMTPQCLKEDLEVLGRIGWEAVVVDECQRSGTSSFLEQIKMLNTYMRLLLVGGQLKDCVEEYVNLLSVLDSHDRNESDSTSPRPKNAMSVLKERLSKHIAYGQKPDSSRLIEYWVPVHISDVQLEHYCYTLLSNSFSLLSSSKSKAVGALCNLLISARKCCDHPYVLEPLLQTLLLKDHQAYEYLEIGIKASGKLQTLDTMLVEMKKHGKRGLILFQPVGSAKDSLGDILDDFVAQKFGVDSYERVDKGVLHSKKLAALKTFNDKNSGRFIFLLEKSACVPSIRLSSVDTVIIFNSDWNPLNDVKQLQKISLGSSYEKIKIFRLYSAFTVEEKVLILSKQDKTLDSQLQGISLSTFHSLLMWGASYLFDKLTVFHDDNVPGISERTLSEQSLVNEVMGEFSSILSEDEEKNGIQSFCRITQIVHHGGMYCTDQSLFGEQQIQVIDERPPHMFWKTLFEGRQPRWRYTSVSSQQRNRKKVQQLDSSLDRLGVEADDIRKRKSKLLENIVDQPSVKCGVKGKMFVKSNEGISWTMVGNLCQPLPGATAGTNGPVLANACHSTRGRNIQGSPDTDMFDSEEGGKILDTQKSLYILLKPAIAKLSHVLELPENARSMADEFLEYVMVNLHVDGEPLAVLQAFQLSVCWVAASLQKIKIDHKLSLTRAKQYLNFECKKEETDYVYAMLRCLKQLFCYHSRSFSMLGSARASDSSSTLHLAMLDAKGIGDNLNDCAANQSYSPTSVHQSLRLVPEIDLALKGTAKSIKVIRKKCEKKMGKLVEKQQNEMHDLVERLSSDHLAKLEDDYKIKSAVLRSCTPDAEVKASKLKLLEREFLLEREAIKFDIDMHLKDLQASHLAGQQKLRDIGMSWIEEVKSWALVELLNVSLSENPALWVEYSKLIENIQDLDSVKGGEHVCDPLVDQESDSTMPEKPGIVAREMSETNSKRGALWSSNHTELKSHQQKVDNVDKANITLNGICENQNILATMSSLSEGQDSEGDRAGLIHPPELLENYSSNDDGEGSFQVSDSCLNPIKGKHPSSSSPSAKGRLDCAESGEVHGKLSLGVAETSHTGVTADNMSCGNPQPGEESMPCDGSSLTGVNALGVLGTVNPEDGLCDVETEAPSSQVQSAAKVSLSLPNAEVAVGNDGFVNGSGVCIDNAVNWTSSSEQIADGTIPDKEETSTRNKMVGSKDALENFVPLHLASSKPDNEGDTVNLSEAGVPGGTSQAVSSELMGRTNIRVDADMNANSLDNVAATDLQGERCGETNLNPHSVEHTVLDSRSRLPSETLVENLKVSLNEALQGEDTPCSLDTLRDADPTVSERQSQLVHLACPVNNAAPSDRSNYQHTVEQIDTFSSLNPPLQQAETSLSENFLPSMLARLSILSASGVQHQPGSSENVSNSITHSTVQAVDNATEISNLVAAEPTLNPEPGPLVDASVAGFGFPVSEVRYTLNSSTNNGHSESAMQVSSRIPPPSSDDPLQNELERIRKEIDEAMKNHEDTKLHLKSDCEKAIEEAVAQIQRKYDVKLKELEGEYIQKRNALDTSHYAVTMHMILAEAFRSKCLDHKPPCMGMQLDAGCTQQQMFQLPRGQKAQRSPLAASPTSSRPSSVYLQNMISTSNQPVVPTLRPAQVLSSLSTRPQMNSIPVATRSIQSSCEIRAPAPHLQPSRPSASSRTSSLSAPPHGISSQQETSNSATATSIPQHPTCTSPSTYQSNAHSVISSLPVSELHVDSRPGTTISMPNNLSDNCTSAGRGPDIVCLSDDD